MSSSPFTLQIDPDYPVVWENTTTIRVGFERAIARVQAPSAAVQSVIAKLIRGTSADELAAEATRVTEAAVAALEPAFVSERPGGEPAEPTHTTKPRAHAGAPPPRLRRAPLGPASPQLNRAARATARTRTQGSTDPPRTTDGIKLPQPSVHTRVYDDGREVPGLRNALEANRVCAFERAAGPPDLAIEVLRYLEPLGRTSRWLGAGVPHLLIRFTDATVKVGPLVAADGAPCHGCETLHLTDADPALPGIAAQLYGAVPCTETPEVGLLVGAAAAYFVRAWRRNEAWVHHHQLSISVAHGRLDAIPSVAEIRTHPDCGCALSDGSRPPPRTATAAALSAPHSQTQTATARRGHE